MKKFPIIKALGNVGVSFVSGIVSRAGSIFTRYPGDTDLGIDGQIEIISNGTSTGLLVAVQIKCGSSYLALAKEPHFTVTAKREDLEYWAAFSIPVILVAFDPVSELSGWLDIKTYIRENPDIVDANSTQLIVPATAFTPTVVSIDLPALCASYRLDVGQWQYVALFISPNERDKYKGFLGLYRNRNYLLSPLTCFLFFHHLFFCPSAALRARVTDIFSRYLLHPEVSLNPPKEIGDYAEALVMQLHRHEIIYLLETAWLDSENMMQRGSLGQSVGVIITMVPAYEQHLAQIALDQSQSDQVRLAAIGLADLFWIQSVLNAVASNLDLVSWGTGDLLEVATWAANSVANVENITVDFDAIIESVGYDADSLAATIENSSMLFLCLNQLTLERIFYKTKNDFVHYITGRALNRIDRWQQKPQQHMQQLL